jgi:S-adenosylmethionine:tRNA ribosyltransferase-isomerase
VLVSEFDFDLPDHLIAQGPPAERGASRLLVVERASGRIVHQRMADLPAWLHPGDVLVVNDTKVFPARLLGHREPSGGRVEVLLLERLDADHWDALVHPGQKLKPGSRFAITATPAVAKASPAPATVPASIHAEPASIHGEIVGRSSFGRRTVRLWTARAPDDAASDARLDAAIDAVGHIPLPPYIHRPEAPIDRERYQTVYARARGSIAAPTAGLHFTPALLERLAAQGVERAAVTLHVGYGTFKPVRSEVVEEHRVDPERYVIADDVAARLNRARAERRRLVVVGTTTVRALESAGSTGAIAAGEGVASLFIHPGAHRFQAVDALVTNFHLPRSSLLMLVCAFAGRDLVLSAYREAVAEGYRFYSYGDAMLIV